MMRPNSPIHAGAVGFRAARVGAAATSIALVLALAGAGCASPPPAKSDAAANDGVGDATANATGCGDPDPGTLEFIDNMEDGDALVLGRDGRNGAWYTFHDETSGTLNPDMGSTPAMEDIVGGRCATSTRAMRVTGSGFSNWGAGFGFGFKSTVNDGGYTTAAYDISGYRGITFWARVGETSVTSVRLGIGDEWSVPQGGRCNLAISQGDGACYDHFGSRITLSTIWKRYTLAFAELQQQSFGTPRPGLEAAAAHLVEFGIPPSSPVFDIWIDDLALYQ